MVTSTIFPPSLELGSSIDRHVDDYHHRRPKITVSLARARLAGKKEPPEGLDFNHDTHDRIDAHEPRCRSGASRENDCVRTHLQYQRNTSSGKGALRAARPVAPPRGSGKARAVGRLCLPDGHHTNSHRSVG